MLTNIIHHGTALEVLARLPTHSVDALVTSPPYAMQRAALYGGVPEEEYPAWTVTYMEQVKRVLKPTGSVLINIREHIKDGQISDYVLLTRLALRAAGWKECEELIWIKPTSAPVGSVDRPRRAWERILWFSPTTKPYCNTKANGKASKRLGWAAGPNAEQWLHTGQGETINSGIARCADFVEVGTNEMEVTGHPAAYPVALAAWMMKLVTPPGGVVLDCFMGSGTTAVAAVRTGFQYVGIEQDVTYYTKATARLQAIAATPTLFTS